MVPTPASARAIAAGDPRPPTPTMTTRASSRSGRVDRWVRMLRDAPSGAGTGGSHQRAILIFRGRLSRAEPRVGISTAPRTGRLLWLRWAGPSATLDGVCGLFSGKGAIPDPEGVSNRDTRARGCGPAQ